MKPPNFDKILSETRRLQFGPGISEMPQGIGTVIISVHCFNNAEQVLNYTRNILIALAEKSSNAWPWPEDDYWQKYLPDWFVKRCAKEHTQEESQDWLKWWDSLSLDDKMRYQQDEQWSLSGWVHWFRPENRKWYWWDAIVDSPDMFRVAIEVYEWPFPWGALKWLLLASGAVCVESKDD